VIAVYLEPGGLVTAVWTAEYMEVERRERGIKISGG